MTYLRTLILRFIRTAPGLRRLQDEEPRGRVLPSGHAMFLPLIQTQVPEAPSHECIRPRAKASSLRGKGTHVPPSQCSLWEEVGLAPQHPASPITEVIRKCSPILSTSAQSRLSVCPVPGTPSCPPGQGARPATLTQACPSAQVTFMQGPSRNRHRKIRARPPWASGRAGTRAGPLGGDED